MPRPHARKKGRLIYFILGVSAVGFLYFFPDSRFSLGFRDVLYRVVSPVSSVLRKGGRRLVSFYHDYFRWVDARRENRLLKEELEGLRTENIRLQEERLESSGLGSALEGASIPTLARVVAYDPVNPRQSLLIDKGELEGVKPDDIVLAGGALVGRVLKVTPRFAQVLLLTDPDHAVGVLDQGSRAKGILVGKKKNLELNRERWLTQAEYLSGAEEVRTGDLLLTSGTDGVFPKGIPVGEVRRVEKDGTGLFWQAEVEPRVEVTKLEYVQILPRLTRERAAEDG